jgi:hypothetical protein
MKIIPSPPLGERVRGRGVYFHGKTLTRFWFPGRVNLFFKQFTAITLLYGSFWSFVLRRETENEITRLINKLRWRHKSKTHYL